MTHPQSERFSVRLILYFCNFQPQPIDVLVPATLTEEKT
jgi:hypothetical protein